MEHLLLQQRFLVERLKDWRLEEIDEISKLLTQIAAKIAGV
jgi:hypothetical protein